MNQKSIVRKYGVFIHQGFDSVTLWIKQQSCKGIVLPVFASILDEFSLNELVIRFNSFAITAGYKWCIENEKSRESCYKDRLQDFFPIFVQIDSS